MRIPGFDLNHRSTLLPFRFLGMNPLEYLTTLQGYYSSSSFDITDLFKNGEQGVWYDPNDLGTLWQDSAGTTPVTAAGQPVGLMLDKSRGLVRGNELQPTNNLSGFSSSQGGISGVTLTSFTTDSGGRGLSKSMLGVGKWYELQIAGSSSTSITVNTGDGLDPSGRTKLRAGFGACRFFADRPFLYLRNDGAGTTTVTGLSLRELPGAHAFQPTAASRPMLRQNATTGAYYLETDGSDDWMQTSPIDFTGTDEVSVFTGVRKLSDSAQAVVAELSATSFSTNGSFALIAPQAAAANNYIFRSRGTLTSEAVTGGVYASPVTSVISATSLIASYSNILRVNGAQVANSVANQGTGNYGNYPLYLFRRAGTSLPFNGHFYGLTIVGRLCTDAEMRNVERLYAGKTGVTLA